MNSPQLVGARLRELRKERHLKLSAAAQETGLTENTLGRLERGGYYPRYWNLIALATYYGVSLDWLCGFTPTTTKE